MWPQLHAARIPHVRHVHAHVAAVHGSTIGQGVQALRVVVVVQILHGHHLRQKVSYVRRRLPQLVLISVEEGKQDTTRLVAPILKITDTQHACMMDEE